MILLNTFCSLGINCFTRTILTRWGLKPVKTEGELTLPFDLCVCPINSIASLLKNQFFDFFNDIIFDEAENVFKNYKYKIIFNHDKDLSDIKQLKERYKQRIENFYKLKKENYTKIYIITTINDATPISAINDIFSCIEGNTIFAWYHIGKNNISKLLDESSMQLFNYKFIPNPYPIFWGEWYKKEFFSSPQGFLFEKNYIDNITLLLQNKLKLNFSIDDFLTHTDSFNKA